MSTQNKNGNGIAEKEAPKTTPVVNLETKPGKETEVKNLPAVVKKESFNLPPLEDRLHRLNELFALQQKYNKLQDSLQRLNDFEIKKDGERSRISISDDNRNEFTTYNPEIVKEVKDFMKVKIKEKIKAIEPLLKW